MNLGVGSRGYVNFEESASGVKEQYFGGGGDKEQEVVCVCMCVSMCVHAHTLKIGVYLNMLKRRTKIHKAKKEELKTIAREVKAEQRW